MPHKIFISYRRDDAAIEASWIYHSLIRLFGESVVFYDKNEINAGDRWTDVLKNKVAGAQIVLVLIGPNWLKAQDKQNHRRRLDMEEDWVRKEIALALQQFESGKTKKIIPVLLNRASLPAESAQLPLDIAAIRQHELMRLEINSPFEFLKNLYKSLQPSIQPIADFQSVHIPSPFDLPDYPLPASLPRPQAPFVGLKYFETSDARIFFGRSEALSILIEKIFSPSANILLLYAQSGSGKSSLLNAGLIPRLKENLPIVSIRSEKSLGLGAQIVNAFENINATQSPILLLIDQAEEIFSKPHAERANEPKEFTSAIVKTLSIYPKARLVISFRKEYLPEFSKILQEAGLDYNEFFLNRLGSSEIKEAVEGASRDSSLNEKYGLEIEPGLSTQIADELVGDPQSQIAPLLQLLLRKMWDQVSNNPVPRQFTLQLYKQFRQDNLLSMLQMQLSEVQISWPTEASSGLTLDLLRFYTTTEGFAEECEDQNLKENYHHIPKILELKSALRDVYLLNENNSGDKTRLAHDQLAPLVLTLFNQSVLPGQMASQLLQSSIQTATSLSKNAFISVKSGLNGRKRLNEREITVYNKALIDHFQAIARDLIGYNKFEEALEICQQALLIKPVYGFKDELATIEMAHHAIAQHKLIRTKSYKECILEQSKIKQRLLKWLENLSIEKNAETLQIALAQIIQGNVTESINGLVEHASNYGLLEWTNELQPLYAQFDQLQKDNWHRIISWDDYFLLFSQSVLHFNQFLHKSFLELEPNSDKLPTFKEALLSFLLEYKSEYANIWQDGISTLVKEIKESPNLDYAGNLLKLVQIKTFSNFDKASYYSETFRSKTRNRLLANFPLPPQSKPLPVAPAPSSIQNILLLLGENKLWEAIHGLGAYAKKTGDMEIIRDLSMSTSSYEKNEYEATLGIIDYNTYQLNNNKIRHQLAQLACLEIPQKANEQHAQSDQAFVRLIREPVQDDTHPQFLPLEHIFNFDCSQKLIIDAVTISGGMHSITKDIDQFLLDVDNSRLYVTRWNNSLAGFVQQHNKAGEFKNPESARLDRWELLKEQLQPPQSKTEIIDEIVEANIDQAIILFIKYLEKREHNKDYLNQITLLAGRYNFTEDENKKGLLDYEEHSIQLNQIVNELIVMVQSCPE